MHLLGVKHRPLHKIAGNSVRKEDMQQIFQQCAQIFLPLSTVQFALSFSSCKRLQLPFMGDSALPPWITSHWPLKCFRQVFLIRIMLCYWKLARGCCHFYSYCYRAMLLLFLLARRQQATSWLEKNTFTTTSNFSYVYGKRIKS